MTTAHHPIPDSYWLRPGLLLAGEYPGGVDEPATRDKLRRLLAAGVTFFLDLTEEGDLPPYAPLLREEAPDTTRPIEHHRLPIRDFGLPSPEQMRCTLDTIDAALAAGHVVYVHCWAGMGRTGTVAGCYLVRHGMSGEEALREIARLRAGTPRGRRPSPETEAQRRMVMEWKRNDTTAGM